MLIILGILGFLMIVGSLLLLIFKKPENNYKKSLFISIGILGIIFFFISATLRDTSSHEATTTDTAATQTETEVEEEKQLPKVELTIDKTEYETDENADVTITGKTEPGTLLTMSFDLIGLGNKEDMLTQDIPVNDDGTFSVDVYWETNYIFYASKEGKADNEVTVSVKHSQAAKDYLKQQEEAEKQKLIKQGKENAKNISYKHLKKNADPYTGEPYFIKGQVIQALEENETTLLRVNITNKGYGFYDDTMAVLVNGTTEALEDDIVEVFGTITGNFSYESTIGAQITIPGMSAEPNDVKIVK
ncbi:hypothetical protein P9246_17670 [Aeribacillus pallidus]|jgi:hypothetical protein|uniref:hypothetical protein n=1 Tax=Aeribacillus composti TaxID=1868734 RepID=UPI002E1FD05C|nr:hypothetical protein [Aeribacillus composti]MED4488542.1 hypothetical protein [Aeribacillus pallidus]